MKQLTGKTAIVTGANSGIGLEASKVFSGLGAQIIMAVRDLEKGKAARELILDVDKDALVTVMKLDLADLASVHAFVESFKNKHDSLDLLINNAGVMTPPYSKTKDGFELQFGSNHLGHFALTGLLMPLLKNTPDSRVVSLSSLAHKGAKIDFDNLDGAKGYKAMKFYGQSKLANLLFAQELDKRFKAYDLQTVSIACHPGISATNLFKFGKRDAPKLMKSLMHNFLQPPAMGALPTIYAATDSRLTGGEYIGPDGKGQRKGYPTLDTPHASAGDQAVAQKLWDVSEKLTGVQFDFSKV
ncbi:MULTISPECIES: oxidoreductase [Planococcus]|uniref:Short-chain dehydrogenase n=2 Tax=Planococcus TaxID=1372 RepID=A0ABM5WYN2_9BACL|nr:MULTISPECIES: oxidoreductase [Planococcus]ALS79480.1 short-chain dehydrogenase [Planococcus kocurii]AQU78551.1 short-chain dehydrogenase [Planococcus faecalis]KAA0957006.1 SDR family NAD(P)-dependent oxidoreductase [Planococcus sp. ANT_H30]MDJ0331485.1 oxidoreductase [Planococcus sp. S3-L1]OHX53254.1 short-chain dehydrogenase [Planococcus faecalis]